MSRGYRVVGALAVAMVVVAGLGVGTPAVAGPTDRATTGVAYSLTGTLVPADAQIGQQLAVNWDGAAGAELAAVLHPPGGRATQLLASQSLTPGVNLYPLSASVPAGGELELRASDPHGRVLTSWRAPVTELLAESGFGWESWFHGPGLDAGAAAGGVGGASALAVWDDGTGPALYAGGVMVTAGEHEVNRVARWDGTGWTPLTGPDGPGVWRDGSGNPSVKAFAVYDGALIVGGYFDNAGGVSANNIARWDGSQWSTLGDGLTGSIGVESLTVHDGELIAGGHFTTAGGSGASRVARWDGTQWSPLATGVDGTVFALRSFDGDLYVGGSFNHADGAPASRLARWDGAGWQQVGGGTNNTVRSFATYQGELVVGGLFTVAGTREVGRIASWDGQRWAALGVGVAGPGNVTVYALTGFDGSLVAAGNFREAGGQTVNYLARWDGAQWSPLAGPAGVGADNGTSTVVEYDGLLIAASAAFSQVGGVVVNYLAAWDGQQWSALPGGPSNGLAGSTASTANALTIWDGALVVAGTFSRAGGQRASRVARWDGATWTPLTGAFGNGIGGSVNALAVYQGDLIVGGRFGAAGGLSVDNLARFDGAQWSPVAGASGTGTDGSVTTLTTHAGDLFVGGQFRAVDGVSAMHLARYDGQQWSAPGGGTNGNVTTVVAYDGALVAGGSFTTVGGVSADRVARWDGQQWAPVGSGVNGTVNVLAVHDDELYAGGTFTQAGGGVVNRVARLDGGQWAPLVGDGLPGVDAPVNALGSYAGDLYAGGRFDQAGGEPVSRLARWDGQQWSAVAGRGGHNGVGGVTQPNVSALLAYDADQAGPLPAKLMVAGTFHLAGGAASWGIAQYAPVAPLANLTASPPERDFGPVRSGETAAPATITLASTGNEPVEVTRVPAPEAPFAQLAGDCPATPFQLDPASSCQLSYEFAPTGPGEHRQPLSIETSAGPLSVALIGTGVAGPPGIELTPGELAMSLPAGEPGQSPVTLHNPGEAELAWELLDGEPGATAPAPVPGRTGLATGVVAGPDGDAPGRAHGAEPAPEQTPPPAPPAASTGGTVLTHSESMAVLPDHSVSCVNQATGHTRASQYLRSFSLADFGIEDDFLVTEVTFGVQQAHPELVATVNLYTLDGPFQYANLVPVAAEQVRLDPVDDGGLVTVPVRRVLPAGATLVVEIATDDLWGTGWFFAGTNDAGESAPSYFASEACGLPEPTPMANVGFGFPDVHLAMAVVGQEPVDCGAPAWLTAGPASGTIAGGEHSELSVGLDATELAPGQYEAQLCLGSNAPGQSVTVLPVHLTVTEPGGGPDPRACTETITGVHAGPLSVTDGVTCLAAGVQVLGEVNVAAGAGLIGTAAVIQGPVSAIGASVVELHFSQVTGPVLITGTSYSVVLFANQITGSVNLLGAVGPEPTTVAGNTVLGALACFGNEPPPQHHGLPNTVTAGKLGQCAPL